MASEIQVTRGSLHAKGPESLLPGELFWVPSNHNGLKDNEYRENPRLPYDYGTLYIGRPSLGDPEKYEAPIPIAGERAYKGMVFRGFIKDETNIADELFKFVREGDFFVFDNDAKGGTFKNEYDFLKGDILLITNADYDIAPNLGDNVGEAKNVEFLRFNGSGGYAKYTYYTGEDMDATNVEEAINELNHKKIQYKGRIEEDYSYAQLMTAQEDNLAALEMGSLYHVTKDGLVFKGKNVDGKDCTWTSQKGDFVIWQDDEAQWLLIPSGYTDANEIDFDPAEAVAQQNQLGTFGEDNGEHIASTSALTNVQEALTYLLSHKAMLDSNGKVPLSQLHDTVLGAMQYCGTWNPITDAQGVNDPTYQNEWPTGRTTDDNKDDEEGTGTGAASKRNNKNGDYYIVKTTAGVKNVQYYDKDSTPLSNGLYSRCEELNSGDWIVYQVDPVTKEASWQVIDNSDALSSLNFFINGTHASGEADYYEPVNEVSLVGNPEMAASDKVVLWQQDNVITVAGVRLIDQDKNDPYRGAASDRYLPVYTGSKDTLKRSSIENYPSENFAGAYVTQTNSNLIIGDPSTSYNEYIYGDIYVRPKLTLKDSANIQENSVIKFEVITEQGSTVYSTSNLETDPNQINGTHIILPDESSKIVGKLAGCTFIKNRITKVTAKDGNTGYIDNTSIEEHMKPTTTDDFYNDLDISSVEFHAPVMDVNNIETRHITFGQKRNLNPDASNGGAWEDGRFLPTEVLSEVFAHPEQTASNVTNYLPQRSGILINDTDWKNNIKGTTGTLPIYGEDDQRDGESSPRKTLIDSKITQVSNSLFQTLFHTPSDIGHDTRTLGEKAFVSNVEYYNETDVDFAQRLYDSIITDSDGKFVEYAGTGTPDNINVNTDTIIGETAQGTNGYEVTTPHSLMVTKSLILGNSTTNMTHVVPGRSLFPESTQYRYAKDEHPRPVKDVYVEPPSTSGVLLTDNSRIDGGFYID